MLYINKITSDPSQQLTLNGIPGISIALNLRFMPRIKQWIMGVSYNDVSIQGITIVTSANILRQFKNKIPFGLSCLRANGLDPYDVNDFANQSANLYLLTTADVAALEAGFYT